MKKLFITMSVLAFLTAPGTGAAQDPVRTDPAKDVHSIELPVVPVELKPGTGLDKVSTLCNICHSLDYITMQPPFPRAQWTATTNKMITVMGAPINEEEAKTIIDYLSTSYGNGK